MWQWLFWYCDTVRKCWGLAYVGWENAGLKWWEITFLLHKWSLKLNNEPRGTCGMYRAVCWAGPSLSSHQVAPGLTFILRTVSKEAALGEYKCFSAGLLQSVNYTTTCSSSQKKQFVFRRWKISLGLKGRTPKTQSQICWGTSDWNVLGYR